MENLRLMKKAGAKEILEALANSPKTFSQLTGVINVHSLQRRLKEFMSEGLVFRRPLTNRRVEYGLTFKGLELASQIVAADKFLAGDLEKLMGKWYNKFAKEWEAYWRIRNQILEEYKGRYVAVCDGKIVAFGSTLNEAASSAQKKHGKKAIYVTKVGEEFIPLVIRSPKLRGI